MKKRKLALTVLILITIVLAILLALFLSECKRVAKVSKTVFSDDSTWVNKDYNVTLHGEGEAGLLTGFVLVDKKEYPVIISVRPRSSLCFFDVFIDEIEYTAFRGYMRISLGQQSISIEDIAVFNDSSCSPANRIFEVFEGLQGKRIVFKKYT